MIPNTRVIPDFPQRPALYKPPAAEYNMAYWRINGYGATLVIWTAEEWAALAIHPTDAQHIPCGLWCALRLD